VPVAHLSTGIHLGKGKNARQLLHHNVVQEEWPFLRVEEAQAEHPV
jgi:hypothetical protein